MDVSSVAAFKYVSYGMLYAFYGYQRCDLEKEYSIVAQFFRLEQTNVWEYVIRVLVNVVVLRLAAMLIMYLKFGNLPDNPLFRLFKKCKDEHSIHTRAELIEIDYDNNVEVIDLETNNQEKVLKPVRANNEVEFDRFSRGKILIGWRNLCLYGQSTIYEMGSTKVSRRSPILRNLNGQFRFGTLNALMGTSGAGKTSLLRVLNGQCKTRLSDCTQNYLSKFTKITTCFITQEVSGHLMPGLTAKQMLVYASRLKNANEAVDHEAIAISLLNELDLANTAKTRVERCSGGERKRLALALELASRQMPNLVCIDEPTSGLDSNSAEIVSIGVPLVTAILTIHPRSSPACAN